MEIKLPKPKLSLISVEKYVILSKILRGFKHQVLIENDNLNRVKLWLESYDFWLKSKLD